jgi:hypothetical protein
LPKCPFFAKQLHLYSFLSKEINYFPTGILILLIISDRFFGTVAQEPDSAIKSGNIFAVRRSDHEHQAPEPICELTKLPLNTTLAYNHGFGRRGRFALGWYANISLPAN